MYRLHHIYMHHCVSLCPFPHHCCSVCPPTQCMAPGHCSSPPGATPGHHSSPPLHCFQRGSFRALLPCLLKGGPSAAVCAGEQLVPPRPLQHGGLPARQLLPLASVSSLPSVLVKSTPAREAFVILALHVPWLLLSHVEVCPLCPHHCCTAAPLARYWLRFWVAIWVELPLYALRKRRLRLAAHTLVMLAAFA